MTPDTTDLIRGFTAIEDHWPEYAKADRYATGQIPERFTTAAIRQKLAGSGDAYRFRLARKPITSLTNRVGISSITGSAAATTLIEQVRRANDMEQQEPFLIDRLATYGDAYWFEWPIDPEDEDVPEDLRKAGVKITYHSPYNTRAMYESEDGRDLQYVIRRWKTLTEIGEEQWHAELWYADRVEPWICDPGASGSDPLQWHPYTDEDQPNVWPILHDLGEVPIKHARTALPYGRPQHADAYGPQDAITKLIVTQAEVDLEAHGFPERARIVDEKAAEDGARDTVAWDDDAEAPRADTGSTQRRSGPGVEHVYRATKSVQEFTPPDPTKLNPTLEMWVRLMSSVTDTPAWEFDPTSGDQLSGIARWRAERPLRDREATFKRFLLHFLRDTYRLACRIKGIDPGEIEVEWSVSEVQADPDWWAVATARRDHGVPQEQILTEAGYLPGQIADFMDEHADERFWGERVRVLSELSVALEKLSGPVSLGIIDAAKVSALVDKIMSDAGESPIGGDGQDKPEPAPVLQLPPGQPGQELPA